MARTKQTIKNSAYSLICYLLIAVFLLVNRRLFTKYLPTIYLGYEGLFGNIFALFSLAEMGVESFVYYRISASFANGEEDLVAKNLNIVKSLYQIASLIILVLGLGFLPFINVVFKDVECTPYVYLVYLFLLLTTVGVYFLRYKRIVFLVDQQNYRCVRIDTITSLIASLLQAFAIVFFRSYILYLIINFLSKVISNMLIIIFVNKEYPYVNIKNNNGIKEIKEIMKSKEFGDNFISKVCVFLYSSTDNIVISYLLGVNQTALVSNYQTLGTYTSNFIEKIIEPLKAAIGDMVNKKEETFGKEETFMMFNRIFFFLAAFITTSYAILFQNTINIWLGEKFIVSDLFVLAFAANQYVGIIHKPVYYYRDIMGHFEIDKKYIVCAAIMNIVSSILLAKHFGIGGVMIGTVIGHLGFWFGRIKVIYTVYLDSGISKYYLEQFLNIVVMVIEVYCCFYLTSNWSFNLINLCKRIMVCLFVPNIMNVIIFWNSKSMKLVRLFVKKVLKGMK